MAPLGLSKNRIERKKAWQDGLFGLVGPSPPKEGAEYTVSPVRSTRTKLAGPSCAASLPATPAYKAGMDQPAVAITCARITARKVNPNGSRYPRPALAKQVTGVVKAMVRPAVSAM